MTQNMIWALFSEDVSDAPVVETFEDVERAAQRAIRYAEATHGSPTLVELSLEKQGAMAIVVGSDWSTAFFEDNVNGLKLYTVQPGMVPEVGAKPLLYVIGGSQSELDLENTISAAEGMGVPDTTSRLGSGRRRSNGLATCALILSQNSNRRNLTTARGGYARLQTCLMRFAPGQK